MRKKNRKEKEEKRSRRGSDLIMDKYIHTEKDLSSKEISSINRLIQYCEDPQKNKFGLLSIGYNPDNG